MDFGNFTEVHVSHAFDVEVTSGESYQVSITVDDNLWDYVDARQMGQVVYIGLTELHAFVNVHLEADVTMPELRGLTLSGASSGEVSGFSSAEPLDIELSGASSVNMDNLVAGDTEFGVSGASRAKLAGFLVNDATVDLSGASTGIINASGTIDANLSGASHLEYMGDAALGTVETSDASSISKK